jgi:hypothetical protein
VNRFARVHTGSSARRVIMDLILMSSLSADESGTPPKDAKAIDRIGCLFQLLLASCNVN